MIPYFYQEDGKFYEITFSSEEVDKPTIGYIFGQKGLFKILNNKGYEIITKVEAPFDDIKESMECRFPMIRYSVYSQVLTFLREVYKEHKSEGTVLLVLNKKKPLFNQKYRIVIPKQEVSGASVEYDLDYEELEDGEFYAGSIHSHPDFSASQSNVDHDDEIEFEGIHITFGKIAGNDKSVEIHTRICFGGQTKDVDTEDYIELLPRKRKVIVPDSWLTKVTKEIVQWGMGFNRPYNSYAQTHQYDWGQDEVGKQEAEALVVETLIDSVLPSESDLINTKEDHTLTAFSDNF